MLYQHYWQLEEPGIQSRSCWGSGGGFRASIVYGVPLLFPTTFRSYIVRCSQAMRTMRHEGDLRVKLRRVCWHPSDNEVRVEIFAVAQSFVGCRIVKYQVRLALFVSERFFKLLEVVQEGLRARGRFNSTTKWVFDTVADSCENSACVPRLVDWNIHGSVSIAPSSVHVTNNEVLICDYDWNR